MAAAYFPIKWRRKCLSSPQRYHEDEFNKVCKALGDPWMIGARGVQILIIVTWGKKKPLNTSKKRQSSLLYSSNILSKGEKEYNWNRNPLTWDIMFKWINIFPPRLPSFLLYQHHLPVHYPGCASFDSLFFSPYPNSGQYHFLLQFLNLCSFQITPYLNENSLLKGMEEGCKIGAK